MKGKIMFDYTKAVEQVFLEDEETSAVLALACYCGDNCSERAKDVLFNDKENYIAHILRMATNRSSEYHTDIDVLYMLYKARRVIPTLAKEPLTQDRHDTARQLLITLPRITDEKVVYDALNKIIKGCGHVDGNFDICVNAVKMRATNKFANVSDIIDLVYVSDTKDKAVIFADAEKRARADIKKHHLEPLPDVSKICAISSRMIECAKHVYGENSAAYKRIAEEYSETVLVTSKFESYMPTMSDADKRAVAAANEKIAELEESLQLAKNEKQAAIAESDSRIAALESDLKASKESVDQYADAAATLVLAIQNTRASVFSRGVNAAKAQAEHVLGKLRKTR